MRRILRAIGKGLLLAFAAVGFSAVAHLTAEAVGEYATAVIILLSAGTAAALSMHCDEDDL